MKLRSVQIRNEKQVVDHLASKYEKQVVDHMARKDEKQVVVDTAGKDEKQVKTDVSNNDGGLKVPARTNGKKEARIVSSTKRKVASSVPTHSTDDSKDGNPCPKQRKRAKREPDQWWPKTSKSPPPKIGVGTLVTLRVGTDCYGYSVATVRDDGWSLELQPHGNDRRNFFIRWKARVKEWRDESDFTARKRQIRTYFTFGSADNYLDPHF